jgi:multidrug efflux pump subunit AcrA (membrane-fusion protein)
VVKAGKVAEVPIETGAKIGDLVEIRRGPQPGEKAVLRPSEKLHDGALVKPVAR